ncbi:hypothetical protein [Oerskovia flava]|uniref:hypothetical protein n=1 Tax=Oerskovia flava TaxID=2986422 RepID=UPI00223F6C69|nr:hypothetical protein [Oerskovia sp. JB1-3-2]
MRQVSGLSAGSLVGGLVGAVAAGTAIGAAAGYALPALAWVLIGMTLAAIVVFVATVDRPRTRGHHRREPVPLPVYTGQGSRGVVRSIRQRGAEPTTGEPVGTERTLVVLHTPARPTSTEIVVDGAGEATVVGEGMRAASA